MTNSTSGFDLVLRALEHPRKLTRRREVRERKERNKRRRVLWLSMSRKRERERDARWGFSRSILGVAMRPSHYGWDGWPISMRSWMWLSMESRWNGNRGGKHVALTKALDDPETWVSTVWLGLDHGFADERPLIFETMIFGGPLNQDYQNRYSTVEEAREGHERAVKIARTGKLPDEVDEAEAVDLIDEVADALGLGRRDTLDIAGIDDPKRN